MELIAIAFNWLATIVFILTLIVAGLLILRVILNWAGVNPFGRVSYHLTHLTEPLVRPMRQQLGGQFLRYDLLPLVLGIMILFVGLFVSSILQQFGSVLYAITGNIVTGQVASGAMLGALIILLSLLYVAAIFLRWMLPILGVGYSNSFLRFTHAITEPLLKPLRRIFVIRMIDLSPMVAMLLVQFVAHILASALA